MCPVCGIARPTANSTISIIRACVLACLCDAKIGVRSGLICQSQFAIGQNAIIIIISHISNDIYFRLRARAINVQARLGFALVVTTQRPVVVRHNIPSLCDVIGLFPMW